LTNIHDAVVKVHRKLENLRHRIPSNQQRFLRLPHVEPCATSGLPAERIEKFEPQAKAYSKLSISKRNSLVSAKGPSEFDKGRISNTLKTIFGIELPRNLEKFEEVFPKTKWLGVIHADGNGLGEIFLKFNEHLGTNEDGRTYVEAYRKFSISLDICTTNATGYALKNLQMEVTKETSQGEVPIIPLVLGGDDLTLLCDGEYSLKFAKDFLEQFERETQTLNRTQELGDLKKDHAFREIVEQLKIEIGGEQRDIIPFIAGHAFGVRRLGIYAGVAIVKPHYPFHQAYELAEQLLRSAKLVKREVPLPCSAVDFHVLYDSSGVELGEVRNKLKVDDNKTYLYAKPYVVTPEKELKKADQNEWLRPRTWHNLETRVCAMRATEDEDRAKRKLPNSQMHHIRESLQRGKGETDSEVNLFSHRYKKKGFDNLLWKKDEPKSLFFPEKHKADGVEVYGYTTHFLDALDVVDFWKGLEGDTNNSANQEARNGGGQ